MKNIVTRSISGIIYVALIVGSILMGKLWFGALMAVFSIFAMIEFQRMNFNGTGRAVIAGRVVDIIATVALVYLPLCFDISFDLALGLSCLLLAYPIVRMWIALYQTGVSVVSDTAASLMSVGYIGLGLSMFNVAYVFMTTNGHVLALAMFIMIWLNDTGAYCVGSTLGRHRLFERLSPKKSWEGFCGGFVCCIIAGYLCSAWLELPVFTAAQWIAYGMLVSIMATVGDLFESMLKRAHAIKDSGNLIPGHGGILDRIDSLLFVAPATLIFILICDWLM